MKSWGVLGNAALGAQCCTKICPLNSGWESIKWSINSSPTQPFTFNRKRDRACMGRRAAYSGRQLQKLESWRMNSSDEKNTSQFPMVPQCHLQQAVSNRMTGTAYIVLCLYKKMATKRCQINATAIINHLHRLLQQDIITGFAVLFVVSPHHAPISMQTATFHMWPLMRHVSGPSNCISDFLTSASPL